MIRVLTRQYPQPDSSVIAEIIFKYTSHIR